MPTQNPRNWHIPARSVPLLQGSINPTLLIGCLVGQLRY
jgi:hypothetical protein